MSGSYDWLPKLKKAIPKFAFGDKIDMYVMALEGWRRGLNLTFYTIGSKNLIRFKLSDKNNEHHFSVTRGDKVTKKATEICIDKNLTKEYLSNSSVPVPEGRVFTQEATNDEILNYANEIKYPVVIKPLDGRRGKGVISNIKNKEELLNAIKYLKVDLNINKMIVEQYFKGEEYRLYVVNGEVAGVIKRTPANITGNGKDTIQKLIEDKNAERKKVPNLHARLIKIDHEVLQHLDQEGYSLESILENGKKLFLRQKGNLSTGGDSIDFTEEISETVKDIAIKASYAIPGLPQCGVDVLYNSKDNKAVVIEVNSRAGAGGHLFPLEGKARDIPKKIINYYFPNSKIINEDINNLFFDYESYWNLLKSGKAQEIKVAPFPKGEIIMKKFNFIMADKIALNKSQFELIGKKASKFRVSGYLKLKSENEYQLVVAGPKEVVYELKDYVAEKLDKSSKITSEKASNFTGSLKLGFDIYRKPKKTVKIKSKNNSKTNSESKTNLKENKQKVDKKAGI
ncbi:ATP-grasp domain-containing protein [Piscibacillus halophilus]|uniref:D-alanine-D-alanine ligase n=1 Tax=Piscibacillus halophilus TaxID=571933 RepID=A0A1H9ISU7_9BACI|nr:ATP-grasp domain-containing protein [Piscibacillus halophilus]SEQ77475.1 D-alanine-D-alanine ligase [Piscibacillus halophilus]